MAHDHKDSALDKALRRSLTESLDASGANCPDSSILAAYFDGDLSTDEADRCEGHVSICARCQEQLAVLARTEPAVSAGQAAAQPIGLRRLFTLRWLAPLATAAAAVALWVAIGPSSPTIPSTPVGTDASQQQSEAAKQPATAAPATPATEADRLAREAEPSSTSAKKAEMRSAGLEEAKRAAADERSAPQAPPAAAPAAPAAAPEPPQVAHAEPPLPVGTLGTLEKKQAENAATPVAEQKDQAQQAVVAVEAAPEEARTKSRAVTVFSAEGARPQKATKEAEKGLAGGNELQRAARGRADMAALRTSQGIVVSPAGKVLWRFGAQGSIEKSTDGGKSWSHQTSPVATDLLAGSAPSDKVCWAIGTGGTVLRTVDGERWEKVASPTADKGEATSSANASLISITARDALHATVLAVGGKTYFTADGGQIWQSQ